MFTLHIPAVIIINRTIPNINTNSQIYYKESKEEFEIFLCGSSVNQYIDCYVLFFFKRNSSCHRLLPTFGNHIKIIERFIHFCRLGTRIVPVEQVFCVTPQKLPLTAAYFHELLIGREDLLRPFFEKCVKIEEVSRNEQGVTLSITNVTDLVLKLKKTAHDTLLVYFRDMTLKPHTRYTVRIGFKQGIKGGDVNFEVTNFIVAPDKGLKYTISL